MSTSDQVKRLFDDEFIFSDLPMADKATQEITGRIAQMEGKFKAMLTLDQQRMLLDLLDLYAQASAAAQTTIVTHCRQVAEALMGGSTNLN